MLSALIFSEYADASIVALFKDEQGDTKWQHVANFSGSVLIVLLSLTLLGLLFSRFKLRSTNKELREIRRNLEDTVRKRTENLNKSNRLLQETNSLLESEISERKATQTYLRGILASMPSMLIGLNEAHQITHWNRTAESITGKKEEEVIGQRLWDAYPSVTVDPEQVKQVFETTQPEVIKHGQRGQYYFDITIYPLESPQKGVVLIIENVTQRSLAENMLIQRDKMASMGELAATMAYDINTPLRAMLDDVEDVIKDIDSNGVALASQPMLVDALVRGKQASAVVDNLLAFSGSQGAEKQQANIVDIIEHSIELAGDVLSEPSGLKFRELNIEKSYANSLPNVECYVAELQQVFLSLFRHACHALGAREGESLDAPLLQISVREQFESLWVDIQHNGVALSADEQQEIFEPFVQHTTPINPKPIALSNRLSFSYFIVTEHHDGELAVTSGEQSTAFHIQLRSLA